MDKAVFFDAIRGRVNLTERNVPGFDRILDYGQARGTSLSDMAYILATAYWETGAQMAPVVEAYWKSENWRKKNLRYWPWHGRGLIQTTWEDNYVKIGKAIQDDFHLPASPDFTTHPDKLLEWEWSLPALFVGMERGIYTGKKLDDYIDDTPGDDDQFEEYKMARRIVNGTDKDDEIAYLALAFEDGLERAGYEGFRSDKVFPEGPSDPKMEDIDVDVPSDGLLASIMRLVQAILNLFRR